MQDYRGKTLPRVPKAILFDFDGTLIDLRPKWWQPMERAFIKINGSVPEEKLKENISELFRKFPKDQGKLFLLKVMYAIARSAGLSRYKSIKFIKQSRIEYEKSRHINIPFDGIENMLKEIKMKEIKIGIVSSASKSELLQAVKELSFLKGITIISRDDVRELKPQPEPIKKGLNSIKSLAEDTLYIGDFHTDVIAGKAAGTMTCAVLGVEPDISREGLEKPNPDIIIEKTVDILDYL